MATEQHKDLVEPELHIPKTHKTSHQNGGSDEIDVSNLSGKLADEQNAGEIKAKTVDITGIADGNIIYYDSASNTWKVKAESGAAKLWHRYNFSTRLKVGIGASAASSGVIQDVPCIIFIKDKDQNALACNEVLPEFDLSTNNPYFRVPWIIGATAPTVGSNVVRVQLDLRYRAFGEAWSGAYDETITTDISLVNGVSYQRGYTDFTLDRTLISAEDGINVKFTRLGLHANDTYDDDWGISQIWFIYKGDSGV